MTRLDAIRQRVERATPEPVVVGEKGGPSGMHSVVNRRGNILGMFPAKRDAEWYAHSREDIPALLSVVEAARQLTAQAQPGVVFKTAGRPDLGIPPMQTVGFYTVAPAPMEALVAALVPLLQEVEG